MTLLTYYTGYIALCAACIAIKIGQGLFWFFCGVGFLMMAGIISGAGAILDWVVRFAHSRFDGDAGAAADVPQREGRHT